ncbi:MAG: DUF924 family protein [Burkholderiales bacterium]|nr:DUF924 family protein [Burkholderiales bacterium]
MSAPTHNAAQAVLDFWFAAEGEPEHGAVRGLWFRKSDDTDRQIAERFGPLIEQALRGELEAWAAEPHSALAQIVLLDQFTRNSLRDTPRAFAGDKRALAAAMAMVGSRQDETLLPVQRVFVYLPFEHAEGMGMQEEALRLFSRLVVEAPALQGMLDYAQRHHDVVQRFGRFPHRNEILGRQSTSDEIEFLKQPGSRF